MPGARIIADVQIVDPTTLGKAFHVVGEWVMENDNVSSAPFNAPDTFSVLAKLKVNVPPSVAVALFKRSLALFAFVADVELPAEAFVGRRPGRALLMAASRAPVLQVGAGDGVCTRPGFDKLEFLQLFRLALD